VIKKIFRGILEGVRFMHDDCKMAHLDLKACNILINKDMVPKITDYGSCCDANLPQKLITGTP
jgi:serine/threonine protein kinase